MLKLAFLISGRGSNLEAIFKSIKSKKNSIKPTIVISNKSNAQGLKIAKKFGVKTQIVESEEYKGSRWDYDKKIITILQENGVTKDNGLICLVGFTRLVSSQFIKKYKNRIMNIHPSLLPAFPGFLAGNQAVEYGVKYSGCTVHFVNARIDNGPIIIQAVVKVKDNDTGESLAKRILKQEYKIYPEAIRLFAKNKIRISGRRTIIS